MKSYSFNELKSIAQPYFEKYGVKRLYATADGQVFLNHGRAKMHAGIGRVYPLEREVEEVVVEIEAPVKESPEEEITEREGAPALTVAGIRNKLTSVKDVEEARQMLLDETGWLNRSTATKAIEKHIAFLLSDNRAD